MFKRCFDVVLSFVGLIVLLPLLLAVALAVKINSRGSVFFLQERVGRNFKTFCLVKFRSMVEGASNLGPPITSGRDQRVTTVGKIIRKAKIDELPQLVNVLKGDMSLVGPRPEVPKYVELYREEFRVILTVRPGVTDHASILYRDEAEILANYSDPEQGYIEEVLPRKIALYKDYVYSHSFLGDIVILVSTLRAVFKI